MPNPNLRHFDGLDGFCWAIGVVEDRNDPLLLGRCKVRYLGWHPENKEDVPTDQLPWSYPLLTLDNGRSVVGPKEGDWVVSFFKDGVLAQEPVMMGIVPGIPEKESNPDLGFNDPRTSVLSGHKVPRDPVSFPIQHDDGSGSTLLELPIKSNYPQNEPMDIMLRYVDNKESTANRFARNEFIGNSLVTIKKINVGIGQTAVPTPITVWTEPETPYNVRYPYNHSYFSESGHLIEIDDTPNAERLHWYHRSGTFREIHPNGTLVEKIVDNEYHIVLKNRMTHIEAADYETVDWGKQVFVNKDCRPVAPKNYDVTIGANGDANLTVQRGNLNIIVNGVITISAYAINIVTPGSTNIVAGGDLSLDVGGSFVANVVGNATWNAGGSKIIMGEDKEESKEAPAEGNILQNEIQTTVKKNSSGVVVNLSDVQKGGTGGG